MLIFFPEELSDLRRLDRISVIWSRFPRPVSQFWREGQTYHDIYKAFLSRRPQLLKLTCFLQTGLGMVVGWGLTATFQCLGDERCLGGLHYLDGHVAGPGSLDSVQQLHDSHLWCQISSLFAGGCIQIWIWSKDHKVCPFRFPPLQLSGVTNRMVSLLFSV